MLLVECIWITRQNLTDIEVDELRKEKRLSKFGLLKVSFKVSLAAVFKPHGAFLLSSDVTRRIHKITG